MPTPGARSSSHPWQVSTPGQKLFPSLQVEITHQQLAEGCGSHIAEGGTRASKLAEAKVQDSLPSLLQKYPRSVDPETPHKE